MRERLERTVYAFDNNYLWFFFRKSENIEQNLINSW